MKKKTGCCIYCGQTRMLEVEGNVTEEWLNELATDECNCIEAEIARKRAETQAEAEENVETLFRNDMPEAADLLRAAIPAIVKGTLSKIAVDTGRKVKAQVVRTAKGAVKVERSETSKTVIES